MFSQAFKLYLKFEGGYVNHPNDKGGATRYGITEGVARGNGYNGDMKDLPLSLAESIIKKRYWDKFNGDLMPYDIAEKMLNIGTNMGVGTASKMLQNILVIYGQDIKVNGVFGTNSIKALNNVANRVDGIMAIVKYLNALQGARYLAIVESNHSQRVFLKGWTKRLS